MILPNQKEINKLESFDKDKFAEWLKKGVEAFYLGKKFKKKQFEPFETYFNTYVDGSQFPLKLLHSIYLKLSNEDVKQNFRAGLEKAISTMQICDETINQYKELLNIACRIKVHDIVPIIVEKAINIDLDELEEKKQEVLYINILEACHSLVVFNDEKSYQNILKLMDSKQFKRRYADLIFQALCKIYPAKLVENFKKIESSVISLLEENSIKIENLKAMSDSYFEFYSSVLEKNAELSLEQAKAFWEDKIVELINNTNKKAKKV